MAEEIADLVQKTSILLLDVEGTTTSISFVKEKLFPYAEAHARGFLEAGWEEQAVRESVAALRQLSLADVADKRDGVVAVPPEDAPKEEQISGLVDNVKWLMSADRKVGPLKQLQGLIWKKGYDKGELQGHVYDDVAGALEAWRARDARRVFVYSSGSTEAQRLLFSRSTAGDLTPHLAGHYDTAVGGKQEAASYVAIAADIGCPPNQILFLTDVLKEAEAAREAGVRAVLVSRDGNAPLPADVTFPVVRSLAELTCADGAASGAGKRKQQHQEEQPAKVAKASPEASVKTSATEISESAEPAESMSIDEAKVKLADPIESNTESNGVATVEKIVIEEVTSTPESMDTSPELEPVSIEEISEQTEQSEKTENVESKTEVNEAKEKKVEAGKATKTVESVKESEKTVENVELMLDTPPVIEDITDKETDAELAESIDIDPIVEEPLDEVTNDNADMEELQKVGDVLEKECDEILSKVNNVTNLESITVKPLLASISEDSEESIATANNTDSTATVAETKEDMPKPVETTTEVTESTAETATTVTNSDTSTKLKDTVVEPSVMAEKENTAESPKVDGVKIGLKEISEQPKSNGDAKIHINGGSDAKEVGAVKLNGNSNGVERLSAENGVKKVNGSNGDTGEEKNGCAEPVTAETVDLKVKAVATVSPPAEVPADA